jgi:hypothetical protein
MGLKAVGMWSNRKLCFRFARPLFLYTRGERGASPATTCHSDHEVSFVWSQRLLRSAPLPPSRFAPCLLIRSAGGRSRSSRLYECGCMIFNGLNMLLRPEKSKEKGGKSIEVNLGGRSVGKRVLPIRNHSLEAGR